MSVTRNLQVPNEIGNSNQLRVAYGIVALNGAGEAVEVVPGFPTRSPVMLTAFEELAGNCLFGTYDGSTGNLTITSNGGAADSGVQVQWVLIA